MAIKDNEEKAIKLLKEKWVTHRELIKILETTDMSVRQWLVKITHQYLLVEDNPYKESQKGKSKGRGQDKGTRKDCRCYKIMTREELLNACEM